MAGGRVKRCKLCGRVGTRMLELPGGYFTRTAPGREECHDRQACGRRAALIGRWTGKRVLRRVDLDGTKWTIMRATVGVSGGPLYTLICEYRQHRMTSSHFTIDAAKAHVDDFLVSCEIGRGQFPAYQTAGTPLR